MPGKVSIAEYNNKGDLSLETPIEPALRVQKIEIGETSEPCLTDTLLVALFSDVDCQFAFLIDDAEDGHFVPLAAKTETTRIVHLNTAWRIATREYGAEAPQWTVDEVKRFEANGDRPPIVLNAESGGNV